MNEYTVETSKIKSAKGFWDTLHIDILCDEVVLGGYNRNYSSFYNTFYPFEYRGREYALYSSNYTATRVMKLPECRDIGGETPSADGFCPVEYYVPELSGYNKDTKEYFSHPDSGSLGFVAGCVWGDDDSWKMQYINLSQVEKGIICRDPDNLGYVILAAGTSLKDAIDVDSVEEGIWECSIRHEVQKWVDIKHAT